MPPVVGPPVAHRIWREARERALTAVRAGGLVLVLGPPGTGKSQLLRELARALEASGYDVLLQTRGDVPVETDAAAPGEPADRPDGTPARVVPERARPRVVLIDEAHRLDAAALDRLGRLGARRVVLAGLSGDGGGLDRSPARAAVVHLAPLPPDEVGAFAAAWLARDGRRAPPPDEHAARRLAERSGGVPRALDALLGAAASLAAAEGASRIEASHVERAETTNGGAAASAPPSPRADIRADAPPVARPDGDPAPARGATAQVRPSAVLGASLCAAAGVAAVSGWLSWQSDERARRERPASARPVAALAQAPGPGRIEAAPAPPVTVPAVPASTTPATVAAVEPSESDRPGPVPLDAPAPPEPPPAVSEAVAPASPDPAVPAEMEAANAAVAAAVAPEPATPAAVQPDASTAADAALPAAAEPGAAAVPGPTTPTATQPEAVAPVRAGTSVGPEPATAAASRAALETVAPAAPEPDTAAPVQPGTPAGTGPGPGAAAPPEWREQARDAPMPAPARSGPEVAAAARPPAALPAGAPAHVVIYHPRDDARAAARAADLARALRAAGMAAGAPVPAPPRGGKPGVRYFFAEDRDAAAAVLERAGLAAEDVLPGVARPGVLPRPGSIEVILPPG